jgi:hypothetical protein
MLHRNELIANPRGEDMKSLSMDESILAALEAAPSMKRLPEAKTEKKKIWRGWWQGIVSRVIRNGIMEACSHWKRVV